MSGDELFYELSCNELSGGELSSDELSGDKLSGDELSVQPSLPVVVSAVTRHPGSSGCCQQPKKAES